MFPWLVRRFGLGSLRRRDELDDRGTVLALFARFADEYAAGLLVVLMPRFQARLALSVTQVGWLWQVLFSTAAVVEPIASAAIDVIRRRPLLIAGALGWGAALLVAAGAPTFGWLLAAFALVGAATGPLTATADVVLVEGHPGAEERITSRSTALDTFGALLAPVAVAVASWWGVDDWVLLVSAGTALCGYAALLRGAAIPPPAGRAEDRSPLEHVRANVRAVLHDRSARRWLGALLVHEVLGLSELFEPVWLAAEVGTPQPLIAVHVGLGMAASLTTLLLLDRVLRRVDPLRVLTGAAIGTLVLYPAWLLAPGTALKLLLVVPRDAVMAPLWPILRSRSLAAVPGAGGTTSALYALLGLVPLQVLFGWAASRVGLTATMLTVHLAATVALVALVGRLGTPPSVDADA